MEQLLDAEFSQKEWVKRLIRFASWLDIGCYAAAALASADAYVQASRPSSWFFLFCFGLFVMLLTRRAALTIQSMHTR